MISTAARGTWVALGVAFLAGCAAHRPPAVWHRGVVEPQPHRLIAFWVLRDLADEPVTIDRDYGMLIVWDEYVRRFYLFDSPRKTYFVTEDFDLFLSELDRLPEHITLDWPDTCCAPRFWKMPTEARRRLHGVFEQGKRAETRGSYEPHIVCYCESEGLKLLGAEPDAELYGARAAGNPPRRGGGM